MDVAKRSQDTPAVFPSPLLLVDLALQITHNLDLEEERAPLYSKTPLIGGNLGAFEFKEALSSCL